MKKFNSVEKQKPVSGASATEAPVYRHHGDTVQASKAHVSSTGGGDFIHEHFEPSDSVKSPRFRSRFWQSFRGPFGVLQLLGAALLLALLINQFVFQSYQVFGESMSPTLHQGDRLIVSKLGISWAKLRGHDFVPKRGEIIVFDSPSVNNQQLVKRVVGLPGERVVVKNGYITVYNIEEPNGFRPDELVDVDFLDYTAGDTSITLKSNELFVVGDNRATNASLDSRNDLGPIPIENVIGTLVMRIFPLSDASFY